VFAFIALESWGSAAGESTLIAAAVYAARPTTSTSCRLSRRRHAAILGDNAGTARPSGGQRLANRYGRFVRSTPRN